MAADRVDKKSEAYRIIKLVVTRGSQDHARKYLADQPTAHKQLTVACMLQEAASEEYGPHRASSLADDIIASLYRKVVDFGERAHKLTEKQIEAIVRDTVLPHRGSKLNKEIKPLQRRPDMNQFFTDYINSGNAIIQKRQAAMVGKDERTQERHQRVIDRETERIAEVSRRLDAMSDEQQALVERCLRNCSDALDGDGNLADPLLSFSEYWDGSLAV